MYNYYQLNKKSLAQAISGQCQEDYYCSFRKLDYIKNHLKRRGEEITHVLRLQTLQKEVTDLTLETKESFQAKWTTSIYQEPQSY